VSNPSVPVAPDDPVVVRLRRFFLTVVTTSSLVLIPWIAYLATSLPTRQVADPWNFAWVGFDSALVLMLSWTAWNAWHRLQMLIPSAIITATLLICDAWFDIVLDWGSQHVLVSIASALLAELPLAALLLGVALRLIRMIHRVRWYELGRDGDPPPIRRALIPDLLRPDSQGDR
jgi:hypothetical protein